jgi:endonuclease/exonuclease/phosphatase family metal-dependent hydrolase
MIIYSWNMLYSNEEPIKAVDFIKESGFNIFCLQEVPEHVLAELQKLPYQVAFVVETLLETSSRKFPTYSVILSTYPITNTKEISFPKPPEPFRSKCARFGLNLLRKSEPIVHVGPRRCLYIDVLVQEKTVRVFNIHLSLSFPKQRNLELRNALEYKSEYSIVCGDFNILERFYIAVLNWLLGGLCTDWLFYTRERRNIEDYFKTLDIQNPLRNMMTHRISRSQLDHILVPRTAQVTEHSVIANGHGSDHNPVRVEISA